MRWIVDTSAWGRRDIPAVAEQLDALLEDDENAVWVMSPTVLLELLHGPQRGDVVELRNELQESFEILEADAETFSLAADAMSTLSALSPVAHRRPISDLVTAALAHQHGCGVVHLDGDFEALAEHSGLNFREYRIELPAPTGGHPAADLRAMVKEMRQLLYRKPFADAQVFLQGALRQLRREDGDSPSE